MATLTCPGCGNFGDGGRAETSFDYLVRDGLIELRRCRSCGAGLLVRFTLMPTQAHPEVIPVEAWDEIRRIRGLSTVRALTSERGTGKAA